MAIDPDEEEIDFLEGNRPFVDIGISVDYALRFALAVTVIVVVVCWWLRA